MLITLDIKTFFTSLSLSLSFSTTKTHLSLSVFRLRKETEKPLALIIISRHTDPTRNLRSSRARALVLRRRRARLARVIYGPGARQSEPTIVISEKKGPRYSHHSRLA